MCCPPNLANNSTKTLPHLHHQMILVKEEWLEPHTLLVCSTSLQFQAKCTCWRTQWQHRLHFPKTLGQEEFVAQEIFCGPHHKVTMLNRKAKYLGLNLVIVGMAFVKINLQHSSFFKQKFFWLTASEIVESLYACGNFFFTYTHPTAFAFNNSIGGSSQVWPSRMIIRNCQRLVDLTDFSLVSFTC